MVNLKIYSNTRVNNFISGHCFYNKYIFVNSQFHKTLPKSSLQMHWISVRFYERGGNMIQNVITRANKSIPALHYIPNTKRFQLIETVK